MQELTAAHLEQAEIQLYTTCVISVGIPGDFNHDGTIDAADYVVCDKTGGSRDEYIAWRANFGETFSFGSGSGTTGSANSFADPRCPAVPKPDSLVLRPLDGVFGEEEPHRKFRELVDA